MTQLSGLEKGTPPYKVFNYETCILHKTHVPVSDTVSDTDTPRIRPDMYPRRIGEIHVF